MSKEPPPLSRVLAVQKRVEGAELPVAALETDLLTLASGYHNKLTYPPSIPSPLSANSQYKTQVFMIRWPKCMTNACAHFFAEH